MPMVPGLSADMPSRVASEDDLLLSGMTEYLATTDMFDYLPPQPPQLTSDDDFSQNYMFDDIEQIWADALKQDCFLGKPEDHCLRECGQNGETDYTSKFSGCSPNVLTIANPCGQEEYLGLVNPQLVYTQQLSHNPLTDHCYYQTTGYPDCEVKEEPNYDYGSDSPTDDSADEIVDVETIQDKVEPPAAKVVKKRGRKPVKKLKFSNSKPAVLNNKRTTAVKRGNKIVHSGRVTKGRRRGKSSCEPSSASSSDAEEIGKRSNHNNMERHRRDEQKRMLQGLRVLVPAIKNNPKAPKVMILTEAAKFILQLRSQEQSLLSEKQKHKKNLQITKELLQRQSISRL